VAAVVGVAVTVAPAGVPVARARAVAVWHAALAMPATLVPRLVALPTIAVCTPLLELAMLVPSALTVGARLAAEPATEVSAAFTVGARLVAEPETAVTAALIVGAARVAAPEAVVATLPVVAVALELLHAASSGSVRSVPAMTAIRSFAWWRCIRSILYPDAEAARPARFCAA
jgi:hypothetical protein